MDIGRQRALIRKSATARKQQGEASASAPKVVLKAINKRKSEAEDDRPPKKGTGPSTRDQQRKSPPPPHYGVGKGLMTGKGPIVSDLV